jgi:hypothetical protein
MHFDRFPHRGFMNTPGFGAERFRLSAAKARLPEPA